LVIVIIRGVLVLAVVPVQLENLYRVLDAVALSVTWVPDRYVPGERVGVTFCVLVGVALTVPSADGLAAMVSVYCVVLMTMPVALPVGSVRLAATLLESWIVPLSAEEEDTSRPAVLCGDATVYLNTSELEEEPEE
jgi:hypothetical protein